MQYPINKDGSAKIAVIKRIVIIAKIVLDIELFLVFCITHPNCSVVSVSIVP